MRKLDIVIAEQIYNYSFVVAETLALDPNDLLMFSRKIIKKVKKELLKEIKEDPESAIRKYKLFNQ